MNEYSLDAGSPVLVNKGRQCLHSLPDGEYIIGATVGRKYVEAEALPDSEWLGSNRRYFSQLKLDYIWNNAIDKLANYSLVWNIHSDYDYAPEIMIHLSKVLIALIDLF